MTLHDFSRLIDPWILPPGLNFLIILFGIVLSFFFRQLGKLFILLGFVSLWLFSTPIIAYKLIDLLQKQYPMLKISSLSYNPHDAIVVLGGGGASKKKYDTKNLNANFTSYRINYAAHLYAQSHLSIIVSGGKNKKDENSEADLMANILQNRFNIKKVIKEDKGLNTAGESQYVSNILKENRFNRIFLVTDGWHMPRSMYIFQCRGIKTIPAPMGMIAQPHHSFSNFSPSIKALHMSAVALHEYIGLVWYYIRYNNSCIPISS